LDAANISAGELPDARVSNTLTASNLVAGSEVVADGEVDDEITIAGGNINLGTNTYTGTLGGGNITDDSLTGAQIAELADADISNTLTASNLVTGSSVVADGEVDDDLTINTDKDAIFQDDVKIYLGTSSDVYIMYNSTGGYGELG